MTRLVMLGGLVVLIVAAGVGAQEMPAGVYASAADLRAALVAVDDGGPMAVARVDNTDRTRVNLLRRTEPRGAIVHATGWEVHHVTDGRATIVTGGRLERRGDASGEAMATIVGGEAREVGPGDVIIIPAGTPHWYSQIDGSVSYLEIRYDPGS